MFVDFDVRGQQAFFTGERVIMNYGLFFWDYILARSDGLKLKHTLMIDLFLTVTKLFTSQDIN